MSFKKETEKIVSLQVKGLIQIITSTSFYHPPVTFFQRGANIAIGAPSIV